MRFQMRVKARVAPRLQHARLMAGLGFALLLPGCSVQPVQDVPVAEVPASYAEQPPPGWTASASLHSRWWTAFADPTLDRLIERADRGNLGLQQAVERVRQAQAVLQGVRAGSAPQLTADLAISRQGGPVVNAAGTRGTLLNLSGTLAYEWDLLGRSRLEVEAARLDVRAREALVSSTRLLVLGQVAQTYLSWRALAAERQVLQEHQQALLDIVALAERMQRAGLGTAREVARWRAEGTTIGQEALELERRQAENAHALATLLGLAPPDLNLPAANLAAPTVPLVPAGLPSDLLTRRADIAAAHFSAQAAAQQLGVQQNPWWPVLKLTTNGGLASLELVQWLSSASRNWGLASALTATLLDGGQGTARREQARSQLQQLQLAYREQVLTALREVDDQLSALRTLREQHQLSMQGLDVARQTRLQVEASRQRGLASQFEVLEARRAELRARRTAVQIHWARAQTTVALVRALGGGWAGLPPREPVGASTPVGSSGVNRWAGL